MKILDKYIGGRFLVTFLFIIGLLILVSIVVDLTENIDNMLENDVPFAPIIGYYLNFIPWIVSILAPLFVFISTIFFTSRLTSNSEIIAMISGGVSFYRLLLPYMAIALLIGSMFFISNHYLVPLSNKNKVEFDQKWLGKNKSLGRLLTNIHMKVNEDQILYAKSFSRNSNIGNQVHLETFDGNNVVRKWKASSMKWVDSLQQWELTNVEHREINGDTEILSRKNKELVDLDLEPEDFAYINNVEVVRDARNTLTTPELNRQIKRERKKGSNLVQFFLIEKHKRTATPISVLIFTIMGVSIASRKTRGGTGIHLAFGLLLSAIYMFLLNFSETISETSDISPMLSIWAPNLLFGFITLILVFRAQK